MLGTNGRDYSGAYSKDTYYYKGNKNLDNIAAYIWNYDTNVSSSGSNNWATSELNKINLNTNYWNSLGSKWQDMITSTIWILGGMTSSSNSAKEFYEGERNNAGYGSNPTTYSDEIGLMYPSDYGYASAPENWQLKLNYEEYDSDAIRSNNWMYMGLQEWTITPKTGSSTTAILVKSDGIISYNSTSAYGMFAIRPVFYLKSNVTLLSGDGSNSNPFRLAI